MKKYTFHSDSGHGWLAVKAKELKEFDLIKKISSYSYISKSGKMVYLEEDCDMSLFREKLKRKGVLYMFVEKYKDGQSHIRKLEEFSELQLIVNEKYHRNS